MKLFWAIFLLTGSALAQSTGVGLANGSPASGDLSGTYPGPAVVKINGLAVPPSSPVLGSNSSGQLVNAGAVNGAPNQNIQYASPNCPGGATNCTTVHADAQWSYNASWANSGNQVTIQSTDPPFVCPGGTFPCSSGGDVGKKIQGMGACTTTVACTLEIPATNTIVSVQSATQATISGTASAACSGSTVCLLAWGHDDTSGLQTAFAAAVNEGAGAKGTLQIPCGAMFVNAPPFIVTAAHPQFAVSVIGCASAGALIVPTSDFSGTGATHGLIFYDPFPGGTNLAYAGQDVLSNWFVFGLGNQNVSNVTSGAACIDATQNIMTNIWCAYWGQTTTGMIGINMHGATSLYSGGGNGAGQIDCQVSGNSFTIAGNWIGGDSYCGASTTALKVTNGTLISDGNQYQGAVAISQSGTTIVTMTNDVVTAGMTDTGGTLGIFGGSFVGATLTAVTATITGAAFSGTLQANTSGTTTVSSSSMPGLNVDGASATINANAIKVTSTGIGWVNSGTVNLQNSSVVGGTFPAINMATGSSSVYNDQGNNTFSNTSGAIIANTVGVYNQLATPIFGTCTGTATVSSTLFFFGLGSSSTTCTGTIATTGFITTRAGKLYGFRVDAGTAGVSGDGVIAIQDNGTPISGFTCTLNTATSCQFFATNATIYSYSAGHILTASFTTQLGTTLANVRISLIGN